MKRIIGFFYFVVAFLPILSFAQERVDSMKIFGKKCKYTVLRHRTVAPGAEVTTYQFNAILYNQKYYLMRAHIFKIDMTNPYNSFSPYKATGKYTKPFNRTKADSVTNTQVQEVAREKKLGLKPIASVTCAGFDGENMYEYELHGDVISKGGEFMFGHTLRQLSLYVDPDRVGHIQWTRLNGRIIKADNTSLQSTIGQVNHLLKADNSKITVFCNGYSLTPKDDNAVEIVVQKTDGTKKLLVGDNNVKVISINTGGGLTLGSNDVVLSATNATATEELKTLEVGETINISMEHVDDNGNTVDINHMMAAYDDWSCVRNGVNVLNGEKEVGRPALGFSEDGKTCYWADIESSRDLATGEVISNGPTCALGELLVNLGCYNAVYMDGGPSAEMTLDGDWLTTNSIGGGFQGRTVPGGFMLYSDAPDDPTISKMELDDATSYKLNLKKGFTLKLYGYNQYGEMLDANLAKSSLVTYSCDLGTVTNGVFKATKLGEGYLTISLNGHSDQTIKIHLTPERGDVNLDGSVNVSDVKALSRVMNKEIVDEKALYEADFNGDGRISISDITELITYCKGRQPR